MMKYPGGKRGEWEVCRDAGHALMTTFQDFDWADEVTHVAYGRRWLIEHHFGGDRQKARSGRRFDPRPARLYESRGLQDPLAARYRKALGEEPGPAASVKAGSPSRP